MEDFINHVLLSHFSQDSAFKENTKMFKEKNQWLYFAIKKKKQLKKKLLKINSTSDHMKTQNTCLVEELM